jgi:hypothetical protein
VYDTLDDHQRLFVDPGVDRELAWTDADGKFDF